VVELWQWPHHVHACLYTGDITDHAFMTGTQYSGLRSQASGLRLLDCWWRLLLTRLWAVQRPSGHPNAEAVKIFVLILLYI
jgi:hypothetical protein